MKPYILAALLLFCFLCLLVPAAVADDDPLIIKPFEEGPFYANAGQEVIIRAGWAACRRGFTQAYIQTAASISMEVLYQGQPFIELQPPSREYFGPLHVFDGEPDFECAIPTKDIWASYWTYSFGELEPGEYDVHLLWTSDHQMPDGVDYDGDGHPDPSDFNWEVGFTIIVTE